MSEKIILNVDQRDNAMLALRAATYLLEHPEKADAVLDYGDGHAAMWARRGKRSIIVYEQHSASNSPLNPMEAGRG
ncbi:hypothetical protein [Sphingobium olei]|uniref:Uncharacterized protein n=1 Tax=Sphingobium olei TaxID=420955 RepID=A0ABW3NZ23_9SPHN